MVDQGQTRRRRVKSTTHPTVESLDVSCHVSIEEVRLPTFAPCRFIPLRRTSARNRHMWHSKRSSSMSSGFCTCASSKSASSLTAQGKINFTYPCRAGILRRCISTSGLSMFCTHSAARGKDREGCKVRTKDNDFPSSIYNTLRYALSDLGIMNLKQQEAKSSKARRQGRNQEAP